MEVEPRHVPTLSSLGVLHYQQGRLEEAQPLWERVLEVEPRHLNTLYNLGELHSDQGRPDEARSLWEQALAVNPDDQDIQSALAGL